MRHNRPPTPPGQHPPTPGGQDPPQLDCRDDREAVAAAAGGSRAIATTSMSEKDVGVLFFGGEDQECEDGIDVATEEGSMHAISWRSHSADFVWVFLGGRRCSTQPITHRP